MSFHFRFGGNDATPYARTSPCIISGWKPQPEPPSASDLDGTLDALQRQVDEIPNRAELLQYERRFRELYAMIAQKGDETRKYYAMYNVLEEKKTYVTKEISLINSIHENFTKVMAEKAAAREKLAESVDSTVKSVQATRAKTQARVDDELGTGAAAGTRIGEYKPARDELREWHHPVKPAGQPSKSDSS